MWRKTFPLILSVLLACTTRTEEILLKTELNQANQINSAEKFFSHSDKTFQLIETYHNKLFDLQDTNKDQSLEITETILSKKPFSTLDSNKNGKVTKSESLLVNKQALLQLAEITERTFKEIFTLLDTNKNNVVSPEEVSKNKSLNQDLKDSLSRIITNETNQESFIVKLNDFFDQEINNYQLEKYQNQSKIIIPCYGEGGIFLRFLLKGKSDTYLVPEYPFSGDLNDLSNHLKSLKLKSSNPYLFFGFGTGGLALRIYLFVNKIELHLDTKVTTLGTPHKGSYVLYRSTGQLSQQIVYNSKYIKFLPSSYTGKNYKSIRAENDVILIPKDTKTLQGFEDMVIKEFSHHTILLSEELKSNIF